MKVNIYSSQEVNHPNYMCILHTVINVPLNEIKKTKYFFTSVSYKTIPWPSHTYASLMSCLNYEKCFSVTE